MRFWSAGLRWVTRLAGVAASGMLTVLACRDVSGPPQARPPSSFAKHQIVDAAHNGGTPHFYFLPPMVQMPSVSGTFDASPSPIVEVCALAGSTCGQPPIATYTMTSGVGGQTVRVSSQDGAYQVNWDTRAMSLDLSTTYRITVRVLATELGHCDIKLVSNGAAAKNAQTGDDIVLVDGRTLPVKFRVEQGAVAVIGTSGGVARLDDGAVTLTFPAGALTTPIAVTATPVATGSPGATDASVLAGTLYEFQPSPTTFAAPVTLTVTYPTPLRRGVNAARLVLCKAANNACTPVAGSTVDTSAKTLSAPVTSFSWYGAIPDPELLYAVQTYGQPNAWWLHTANGEVGPFPSTMSGDPAPAWSPDGSKIAYSYHSYGDIYGYSLRVVNADGTGDHSIVVNTPPPSRDPNFGAMRNAVWSPDGRKILFCRSMEISAISDGGWGPAVVNADGSNLHIIYRKGDNCGHGWSPDSRTIAVAGDDGITIYNADGSIARHLVDCDCNNGFTVGWSADGSQIAFYADWAGPQPVDGDPLAPLMGSGIYVVNSDGSNIRRLLPYQLDFAWSAVPGDNRLLFTTRDDRPEYYVAYQPPLGTDPPGVYVVNADGSGLKSVITWPSVNSNFTRLSTFHSVIATPFWSPDATRVGFSFTSGVSEGAAYVVNVDGTGFQRIVGAYDQGVNPIWRR